MPYAFTLDVPANPTIYAEIRAKLGLETPTGLIAHLVQTTEGGLRYTDVWDSEAAWDAFRTTRLFPTVKEVLAGYGLEHEERSVTPVEIDVIDTWVA